MSKSKGPIGVPAASSVARNSPAVTASSSLKASTAMPPDKNTRSRSAFSRRRALRATPYQSSYSTMEETAIALPLETVRRRRLRNIAGSFEERNDGIRIEEIAHANRSSACGIGG
jgi:hypothetical protein